MKSMILIPLVVAGCVGFAALSLRVLGVRFGVMDPLTSTAIAAIAGTVGVLPILRNREKDAVSIVQRALIGTVLHLLCTAALAVVLISSQVENLRGPFIFWLLGAYWVSLAILVWQLRRVMLDMTATLKVQN